MKPGTGTGPTRWKLVMIAGALALLAAGCGSGGGASERALQRNFVVYDGFPGGLTVEFGSVRRRRRPARLAGQAEAGQGGGRHGE